MKNVFSEFKSLLRLAGKIWIVVSSVIGSLFLLLIVLVIISMSKSSDTSDIRIEKKVLTKGGSDVVAVVNISGIIFEDDTGHSGFDLSSATVASKRVIRILNAIENDSQVKAVVLRINSPGGAVVASDEIYRSVRQLAEKKPVIASLGDTAASGGYYIAAGADRIVANPSTMTGSIGVIAQLPQFSGLYDKLGIEMRIIKSGEFKDLGSEARDMTDAERAIFQSVVEDSYAEFVEAVSESRDMSIDEVEKLADGRIYSGKQAYENGLVDELGSFDGALLLAQEEANISNPTVQEYTQMSVFESLFGATFQSPMQSLFPQVLPTQKFGVYYLMGV